MDYYISKKLQHQDFEVAIAQVTEVLKKWGFGILTTIDVQHTLKEKIGTEFRKYKILGACNPHFAHKALLMEDKIGVLLPCNVVVQQFDDGTIEIAAMKPSGAMSVVENPSLEAIANEVEQIMNKVIEAL